MKPKEKKERGNIIGILIDILGGKKNAMALIITAVILLSGEIIYFTMEARKQRESQYIDSWPITMNQHIEWTWAGKSP